MSKSKPWIGVDLDATLAHYDTWPADGSVGKPVAKMVKRVKQWLEDGEDVRIVTARACFDADKGAVPKFDKEQVKIIEAWCKEHLGQALPVQFWKDRFMAELWDDRAVQIVANTGHRADKQP